MIIPGRSLAGINIDDNINDIIGQLIEQYTLEIGEGMISLNDGLLTIGYDADGTIDLVMCDARFGEKYDHRLWAGMSVGDVLQHTSYQIADCGGVVVDGIAGIALPLPPAHDDFERITDFLPLEHIFQHLSVFRVR